MAGNGKSKKSLGVLSLAMINVAAVISLRNVPTMAEYGWSSIFFYAGATLLFMIPVSLAAAELASGWPLNGGVYAWVKAAFGDRSGFLAVWADWAENLVWFPTAVSFIAASLAYAIRPDLANNRVYLITVMLAFFWGTTFANYRGMRASSAISTFGTIAGSLVPGAILIALGIGWVSTGKPSQIPFSTGALLPKFSFANFALFAGTITIFAGMEMAGYHATDTKDPKRDYPKAIFLSALIIVSVTIIATLAIAFVVPQDQISLVAGLLQAFEAFLRAFGLAWAVKPLSILITIGGIALLSTWIIGPAKGLTAPAEDGDLPPFFRRLNRHGVPTRVLVLQGIGATLFSLMFALVPSVNTSYWILTALTSQLIVIMYVLMLLSVLRLRYTQPDAERPYRVPGGIVGVWVIVCAGLAGLVTAFGLGFVPPSQFGSGSPVRYVSIMIGGLLILVAPPAIFLRVKKDSWTATGAEREALDEEMAE